MTDIRASDYLPYFMTTNIKFLLYVSQTHINPERTVPELNFENNVINCDITFDGTSVTARSCKLGKVSLKVNTLVEKYSKSPKSMY